MPPWNKSRNPFSRDLADPIVEKSIILSNLIASFWGVGTPASSKEDSAAQIMLLEYVREVVRALGDSGWYQKGAFSFSSGFPTNSFRVALSRLIASGLPMTVVGTALNSETEGAIVLNAPPGGGTRDDLVFLEMWIAEIPGSTASSPVSTNKPSTSELYKYGNVQFGGTNIDDDINEADFEVRRRVQVQYRIRIVDGVDFSTYPSGVDDPNVKAQGAAANPTAIQFALDSRDSHLFLAGNGSVSHQGTLNTLDGFVYALPLCKVARSAGATEITAPNVTDMRTSSGVLNFVKRDGDTMVGDLSIATSGSRTFLVQTTSNNSLSVLRAIGLEAGGTQVIGEFIADNSGAVRLKAKSNHPLEFYTNDTLVALITAGGIFQTAAGKVFRHDGNSPRFESSTFSVPTNSSLATIAHGLSAKPKSYSAHLLCGTADLGYSPGDEVRIQYGVGDIGMTLSVDGTNIYLAKGSATFQLVHKSSFTANAITNGSWSMIVRADP